MFLAIYQKELGAIYQLFAENENAIARKALLARPPNIPEIPEIIAITGKDGDGNGTVNAIDLPLIAEGFGESKIRKTVEGMKTPLLDDKGVPLDVFFRLGSDRTKPITPDSLVTDPFLKKKGDEIEIDYLETAVTDLVSKDIK